MQEDDNNTNEPMKDTRSKEVRAAIAGFDTLLWQGLASVMIPGGVINCKCQQLELQTIHLDLVCTHNNMQLLFAPLDLLLQGLLVYLR